MHLNQYTTYLVKRMAHGSLKEFDPTKESIEDYKEHYEFYCLANNVKSEGKHAQHKKTLFITLLGQETFAKLKVLTSPMSVTELTLEVPPRTLWATNKRICRTFQVLQASSVERQKHR